MIIFLFFLPIYADQTVDEKIFSLENDLYENRVQDLNKNISSIKNALEQKYLLVEQLIKEDSVEDRYYRDILEEVEELRKELYKVENNWKDSELESPDGSAVWDGGCLGELFKKYGQGFLYVMPGEIESLPVNFHGSIGIPRESWHTILESVLCSKGIGIKEINPYTRELYFVKEKSLDSLHVVSKLPVLDLLRECDRVCYIYTPNNEWLHTINQFLDKLKNASLEIVKASNSLIFVGLRDEVKKLISLCDKISNKEKISKVVYLHKMSPEDGAKLLKSFFVGSSDAGRPFASSKDTPPLFVQVFHKDSLLVLLGSKGVVEKASKILEDTELQMSNNNRTYFWYTCSHKSPSDLAEVLDKMYAVLSKAEGQDNCPEIFKSVADNSSGNLLVVVRKDYLKSVKDIIRKLDLPKKMVEIEVLLCERRINDSIKGGINILRIGDATSNKDEGGLIFDASGESLKRGIFKFFFSGKKGEDYPAYDLVYNFLLSQENIKVTAAPSILTVDRAKATISITDQISINTGVSPVDTGKGGYIFKDSFERADFGIILNLTPTIHEPEMDDDQLYITMDSDISFENIRGDRSSARPDIHKRYITNTIRVADNQTIVLGGLRSKSTENSSDKLPLIGEIPGIGSFFRTNSINDKRTEMFIFIKPKIIANPKEDLIKRREEILTRRPGEHKEILKKISDGCKDKANRKIFNSLRLFYGNGSIGE